MGECALITFNSMRCRGPACLMPTLRSARLNIALIALIALRPGWGSFFSVRIPVGPTTGTFLSGGLFPRCFGASGKANTPEKRFHEIESALRNGDGEPRGDVKFEITVLRTCELSHMIGNYVAQLWGYLVLFFRG